MSYHFQEDDFLLRCTQQCSELEEEDVCSDQTIFVTKRISHSNVGLPSQRRPGLCVHKVKVEGTPAKSHFGVRALEKKK
jgi:hypothetical protein